MAQLPPHAAAGVAAAAWEEEAEWLDVDDSDIASTLRPPRPSRAPAPPRPRTTSTSPSRPPPFRMRCAAASPPARLPLADARKRRLRTPTSFCPRGSARSGSSEEPRVGAAGDQGDQEGRGIVSSTSGGRVVTSCKPNGLGGLLVTLKVLRKDCDATSKQVISSNATERSEGSVDTIMMRLLGHERMIPHNNDMTVIEGSLPHQGISDLNNSTSTEVTLDCRTDGHALRNLNIPNIACAQSSLSESTVMFGDRCSAQASNNENLRRPFGSEKMLHSSKKLKSDVALPGDNGETLSSRIDTEDNYVLQRNMGTELGMAEQLNGQLSSIREPMEDQQRDFIAVNAGSAQPTKEYTTTINGSLLNPKKVVSVGYAEWTDEQLCQLLL